MADPIIIETDINGNPIGNSPPAVTQQQGNGPIETGIDGKPLSLGLQNPGPQLQQRDPNNPAANPGLMVPPLLGAIGAGLGTVAAGVSPFTSVIANPVTGAMAGTGVGEYLKNKFPETFSESGEAPDLTDSLVNTGLAGVTEMGNQVAGGLVKSLAGGTVKEDIARFLASKAGQRFPAVKTAFQKFDLAKGLMREETTNPNPEVSGLISQHNVGGAIKDTSSFLDDARDAYKNNKISKMEFDNLKSFASLSDSVKSDDPNSVAGLFRRVRSGGLVMGTTFLHNPALTGAASGIMLTNETLGYLTSRPGMSNLISYVQTHPDNDAVKKLAKQGILMALRGQEVTMLAPDGTKEKATISDQGVPQLAR